MAVLTVTATLVLSLQQKNKEIEQTFSTIATLGFTEGKETSIIC